MDDYKEIGGLKSTAGTIHHTINAIERAILGKNEQLSESPTAFINILLDQMGSINAANFFETLAIKQEFTKSTAKLRRSLVRYLNSKELRGIFGTPANFSFNLGFKVNDLLERSVRESINLKKLTINRNMLIKVVDKPPFTLDNNIDIYVREIDTVGGDKDYTYFAKYTPDTESIHGIIGNPFIKGFLQNVDGEQYFIMDINLKQYERRYNIFNSLNSGINKHEFSVPYTDNLYAFEVLYRVNDNFNYGILHGEPEGVTNIHGYNFSLTNKTNGSRTLDIKFNRNPEYFSPINGSSVKIITYLTSGEEGNFVIKSWSNDDPPIEGIILRQDDEDEFQKPLRLMEPLITISGEVSSGGKNEMDVEELRNFIIRKSDSKLITLVELEDIAKSHNMRLAKERSDILEIYYRLSGIIQYENVIIDSTSGIVKLDMDKLQTSNTTDTKLLTPISKIKLTDNLFELINESQEEEKLKYIKKYNSLNFNINDREFFFPYFMRINLSSYIDAKVYDMFVNDKRPMIFEYFNETSTSEASVDYCSITRDPLSEEIIEYEDQTLYKGKYKISFDIQINEIIYNQLNNEDIPESDPIRIYIKLKGKSGAFLINNNNINIEKINNDNHIIRVESFIYTDNGIDNSDRIALVDASVEEFPRVSVSFSNYFIDENIDISVYISFKGTKHRDYSDVLSNEDKVLGFNGVSAVYTLKDVELFRNITNIIKPIIDIKLSQGEYNRYTENIQDVYEEIIFETDEHGSIIYEDITLPGGEIKSVPKILHNRFDLKYDTEGNPIYRHLIGDPILDENHPEFKKPKETVFFEIRDFPLVDRIFSEFNNYWTTINALNSIVDRINSFVSVCPTGTSAKLGVLNTIGSGSYFFINRRTGIETSLDRLALSFHIGIKLDEGVDEEAVKQTIRILILDYIRENSTSIKISFMEMLNKVKESIDGIKYYELYKINDYDEGVCHSIYLKEELNNNDIVTIKNNVEIQNNELRFLPDIKITII